MTKNIVTTIYKKLSWFIEYQNAIKITLKVVVTSELVAQCFVCSKRMHLFQFSWSMLQHERQQHWQSVIINEIPLCQLCLNILGTVFRWQKRVLNVSQLTCKYFIAVYIQCWILV